MMEHAAVKAEAAKALAPPVQGECNEDEEDPSSLVDQVETRLRENLSRAAQEYPPGCQADWLAGVVTERLQRQPPQQQQALEAPPMSLESLVKLCVYLMENLADVSSSYEEFYSQQLAALRDEGASAHAQVAALEDENGRLREQLHRRADELRQSQAAVEALKLRNLATAASTAAELRFDEAVAVEEEDDEDLDDGDEAVGEGCRQCTRFREAAERAEAEAARQMAEAATASAALKADIADWEADMAEKVHQNVELAAKLEACQRMLARSAAATSAAAAAAAAKVPASSRGIFGGVPLLTRKK